MEPVGHTRKVRLMQITHDLAIGGLQQVVNTICKFIDRRKFDVSVLCLRNLGPLAEEIKSRSIPVFFLPQKESGTDYFSFLKVAKVLHREQIDVIHTHNTQPFVDGTLGGLLAGVKTFVHTEHGRIFPAKKRYMLAERIMSRYAHKVVAVSEHSYNNLLKYEKISKRKLLVIQNGIDSTTYSRDIDVKQKRRDLGIGTDQFVLGVAARLVREKGLIYLVRAMSKVVEKMPSVCLIIAGKGAEEESLRREAESLSLSGNILFLGERLDIPEILKTIDLYVLPSISEGLPMVILEAMAAGCPIVASKVGGIPSVIQHGINGSLVESGDKDSLASEILRVAEDKGLRLRYSSNSRTLFERRYSAEIMMRKYERLYLEE